MKVVITDYINTPDIEQKVLGGTVSLQCLNTQKEEEFPFSSIKDADALLVWHAHITEKTLRRLKKCKVIVRYGVGYENIDYRGAQKYGIVCCNTPDYGIHEVADTTCAMILCLTRKIFSYNFSAQRIQYGWQEHIQPPILRSSEHRLGVIGAGRIGSAVILRMKSFGMDMGFYDPYVKSGYEKTLDVRRFETLHELIRFSSIISIHAPLTSETEGMIDDRCIEEMSVGTVLVNTARGKIVKSLDLIHNALKSGKLAGVALDVLLDEPPTDSESLIQAWKSQDPAIYPRIIINPHTAYYSERAWREMREKAAMNVKRVFEGRKPLNCIL